MKRILLLSLSHLVLLGAGYGLHSMMKGPADTTTKVVVENPATAPPPVPPSVGSKPGESSWSATDCRKAWRALSSLKISPEELAILRTRLRKEWLAKDLRSALIAWTDEETVNGAELVEMIGVPLTEEKQALIDWVLAGDFGLDGAALMRFWVNYGTILQPELSLEVIGRVPPALQATFLKEVFGRNGGDLDFRLGMIAKLPDERLKAMAWTSTLEGVVKHAWSNDGPDRLHELLGRDDVPQAAREAGLKALVRYSMQTAAPARTKDEFHRLPEEDRRFVAPIFLEEAKRRAFDSETFTHALGMLAEGGHWDLISGQGPPALEEAFKFHGADTKQVATWAQQLPAREEAQETYRHAVAGRFREDLNGSRDWVLSLPEGWHREQALAQLALTADQRHNNAAIRDEALKQITDPALQEEMQEWRRTKAQTR